MRNPLSNAVSRPFSDATPGRPGELLLLDEHLPEYDATVARHAVVDADPATTYDAMLAVDLTDLGPAVAALGWLRDLPRAAADWLRGRPRQPSPGPLRFADVAESSEWTLLDEDPGRELVVGAVGRFWRPAIAWRRVDAGSFAAFDEPGYAKLALSLSVRPYGDGRTLLSYEARTATTDGRARRRFRRYWRVVGPFAGYLLSRAVARAAADAERAAAASSAAGARAASEPEAGAKADAEAEPKSDAEAGAKADAEAEPKSDAEAGAKVDAEAKPKVDAATRTDEGTTVDAEPKSDADHGGRSRAAPRVAAAAAAVGLAAAYHLAVRPWHRRWGATDDERRRTLPGDDLLPEATRQVTRAVDVDAPPEVVWPWLVEVGRDRRAAAWSGFGVGSRVGTASRVVPKYGSLEEGDVVRLGPEAARGSRTEPVSEVVRRDRERALVLRPAGESPGWTWAFVLDPVDDGGTRLLARTRWVSRRSRGGPLSGLPVVGSVASVAGRAVDYLLGEPAHFLTDRRLLKGVKRRAEATARRGATTQRVVAETR